METIVIGASQPEAARAAADVILRGGLVAIPTETVYGLGANGLDADAVLKIFEAKGRPQDNPLILHIAEPAQLEEFCHDIPDSAWVLAEKFWPGPLTMVLPCRPNVPKRTTAGLDTVAVRCPDCARTREVIALAGVPIAAPSANTSGKPSPTTAAHVLHDMAGKVDMILDDGPCRVGVESTIVDLTGETPRLLRPGGITPEQLQETLGSLIIDPAVLGEIDPNAVVRAPGMKYRHYAPAGEVTIVTGSSADAAAYIRRRFLPGDAVLCFREETIFYDGCAPIAYGSEAEPETLARGLFAALREVDESAAKHIYARCPEGGGVAYAVQNRLKKAAGFRTVSAKEENRTMVIGITGGTGCGKTTVLNCLQKLGGSVIDCDAVYHELLKTDAQLLREIAERFPDTVENGALQRKKLGAVVFADPAALEDLNRITTRHIDAEVQRRILAAKLEERPAVAIDAIGLIESGLNRLCDRTIAVTATVEQRVSRLLKRESITEEYARARIAAQKPDTYYEQHCDLLLQNNYDTKAEFESYCIEFLKKLQLGGTKHE